MSRTLTVLLLVAVLVLAGGGIMLYLAYGVQGGVPQRAYVETLEEPVELRWTNAGMVTIEAGSEADALAAVGFAHGLQRAWSILLWRQTALGRLGEWFGPDVIPIDRLTRRLGLARTAQETYAALSDEERALLEAYTGGVNAGLARAERRYEAELALLNLTVDRWEPWQSLAVERLFAWLAVTPPPADSLARAGRDVRDFLRSDSLLRTWLHLHGFENSLAWAVQDSAGVTFYQRHVHGASALPFFLETAVSWPDVPALQGASLPGTPFFPAGRTETRAWSLLLSSQATFVRVPYDTARIPLTYERLRTTGQGEELVTARRSPTQVLFDPSDAWPTIRLGRPGEVGADTLARDTTWAVRWVGLSPGTDLAAWRTLLTGEAADFTLLEGMGLSVTPGGGIQELGPPEHVRRIRNGVLVSRYRWSEHVAARLDSLVDRRDLPFDQLVDDRFSPWAARLAPPLIEAASSVPDPPPAVAEALTYLRNWDYTYDRASIGASLFDTWMAVYRDSTHALPTLDVADTVYFEPLRRYRMLVHAVDRLADRFGTDISQWRWENVQPRRYFFPVWSADTLLADRPDVVARTRYAPIDMPGEGHPTTVMWGPSPVGRQPLASAVWSGVIASGAWDTFEVRRSRFDPNAFFGRYLIMNRPPPPLHLSPEGDAASTTTLLPE